MNLIKNKMNVVLLGFDETTLGLVRFLKEHGYSIYILSMSDEAKSLEYVIQINEDYLFEHATMFDFSVRSRLVEALNPNVIMLREIIPVYNPISFFLEQFECRVIFISGGRIVIKPLMKFLSRQSLTVLKWEDNADTWSLGNSITDSSIMVVQVFPEDLIDMYSRPDIMLVDSFPVNNEGVTIENYVRTQSLLSQMKCELFNVIGEFDSVMKKLKLEFPSSVSHYSTKDNQADFCITGLEVVDTLSLKKELLTTFSKQVCSPASDRHLLQIFAISNIENYRRWVGTF